MIGQKAYSLHHKHSGVTLEDARPSGGSKKKPTARKRVAKKITKGDNDNK